MDFVRSFPGEHLQVSHGGAPIKQLPEFRSNPGKDWHWRQIFKSGREGYAAGKNSNSFEQ